MLSPDHFAELRDLLARLCDADGSFVESHRIEELIGDDDDALAYYLHYMDLHGSLRYYAANIDGRSTPLGEQPKAESLEENPSSPIVQLPSGLIPKLSSVMPWLLLAAVVVVGSIILLDVPQQRESTENVARLDQPRGSALQSVVAQITRASTDCHWGNSDSTVFYGAHLRAGKEVRLDRGLAEITFQNGAVVILEGPAIYELLSQEKTRLHVGRLSAHVPDQATGFTVLTPDAEVVDLGTAFGVRVDFEGHAEVHTFEGEVSLKIGDEKSKRHDLLMVNAGQALHIGQSEPRTRDVLFNERAFTRQEVFESELLAHPNKAYQRWLTYSHKLRKDHDLLVYYTFNHPPKLSLPVVNYAEATSGTFNGELGFDGEGLSTPSWATGRWPEKGALRFEGSSQQVVTIHDSASIDIDDGLSVSVWFKLINPLPFNVICSKWFDYAGPYDKYCFWLGTPSVVLNPDASTYIYGSRLACQVSPNGQVAGYDEYKDECYSEDYTGPADGWVHIVMTVDPRGEGEIHLYKNGYEINQRVGIFMPESLPKTSSPILLGGKVNRDDLDSFFDGLIDEFALFRRALSHEEVLQMYEAGKPELTKWERDGSSYEITARNY